VDEIIKRAFSASRGAINKALAELTAKLGRKVNAVTIGGGLLGLESAAGTEQLGANPIVIDGSQWLMATQLDEGAGQAMGRLIKAKGFAVHGGAVDINKQGFNHFCHPGRCLKKVLKIYHFRL